MIHSSIDAYILKRYPLGETDRVVLFYTAQKGKIRAVAKNALTARSRFSGILEPFSRLSIELYQKTETGIIRLNQVEVTKRYHQILADLDRLEAGYSILGILEKFTPESEPDAAVFSLVTLILDLIEQSNGHPEFWTRVFQFRFFRIAGYALSIFECVRCGKARGVRPGYMHVRSGGVVCRRCLGNRADQVQLLSGTSLAILDRIYQEEITALKFSDDTLIHFMNETGPVIEAVFAYHFDAAAPIKRVFGSNKG